MPNYSSLNHDFAMELQSVRLSSWNLILKIYVNPRYSLHYGMQKPLQNIQALVLKLCCQNLNSSRMGNRSGISTYDLCTEHVNELRTQL